MYHSFEVWFLVHLLLLLHMISSLLSLLNNFIYKPSLGSTNRTSIHSALTSSSSRLLLWLQRRLYQWALFSVAGQAAGGGEELQHYCRSSAAVHKFIMKSPPSSGSRPPRLMAPVTSSSHDLQLLNPSPQFVYDPHAEVLILVFLSLVLLVRLAKELVKLLRYLLLLTRDFAARGREPIIMPPRDAQLQAVAESTTVEIMGEYWIVTMIDFIAGEDNEEDCYIVHS